MKKNIIKIIIGSVFIVGAIVSFNVEAKAIIQPDGQNGVNCSCTNNTGECKANGAGAAQCAPGGKSKCWKYNKNC